MMPMQVPDALMQEFTRLREELPARHIAVTGARGGEGASTVALGIARALASRGPTLLAEGNLRQPVLARRLGLNGPGLAGWDRLAPLPIQELPDSSGLSVLCAGTPAPAGHHDAAALLAAAALAARERFAQVVWDTPPLTLHADLLALGPYIDGALVVVEMDSSRVDELRFLRDALARANMPIVGSLLNRTGRYWPRRRTLPDLAS